MQSAVNQCKRTQIVTTYPKKIMGNELVTQIPLKVRFFAEITENKKP
jgi:hypothetical protein